MNGIESTLQRGVLLVCMLSALCSMTVTISTAPLIGVAAQDLGLDLGSASLLLMALPTLATALGIVMFGFVVDRVGVFPVLLGSQLALVLAGPALLLAGREVPALLVVRLLQGLAAGGITVAITPALARWFAPQQIGRAMGWPPLGALSGVLIGLNAAPWLARELGAWQAGVAALSLLALPALLVTLPVARRAGAARPHEPAPAQPLPLRRPVFWFGMAASALAWWVTMSFGDLAPGFLAVPAPTGAGYGPETAGHMMSLFTLAGALAAPLAGYLTDKRWPGKNRRVIAIGWAMSALFCSALVLGGVHGRTMLLLPALAFAGAAGSLINVPLMSLAAQSFAPAVVGRVCGLWLSVSFFAGAFGVTAGALSLRATGGYGVPLLLVGAACVLGLALAPRLRA